MAPSRAQNRIFPAITSLLLATCVWTDAPAATHRDAFSRSWSSVQALEEKGLTQSALDSVNGIYARAKAMNDQAEIVKSLIFRVKLISLKEEDATSTALRMLRDEIAAARTPLVSVLHSLLGECLRSYYEQNRWRFMERTRMAQNPAVDTNDVSTWDLATIMDRMTREFELSVKDADGLKKVPLNLFDPIITAADGEGAKLRPTLYDFLVHRAIDFLSMDDNDLTRPAQEFTVNDARFFAPAVEFARWSIPSADTASLKFHAVRLLQDLLLFHAHDANPDALIDADLKRLDLVRTHAVLPGKDSLYLRALESLTKRFPGSPGSAEVSYKIAELYHGWAATYQHGVDDRYRWMDRKALEVCEETRKNLPRSYGARLCARLSAEILQKELNFSLDYGQVPNFPMKILVNYRNASLFHGRAVPMTSEEYQKVLSSHDQREKMLARLAEKAPVKTWTVKAPDPGDHRRHSIEDAVPPLPIGHYVIVLGSDARFRTDRQAVAHSAMQVTNISFVDRNRWDGSHEFTVLDRTAGVPLSDVKARAWEMDFDGATGEYLKRLLGTYHADAQGRIVVSSSRNGYRDLHIEFSRGADRLVLNDKFGIHRLRGGWTESHLCTYFFTDRAIYRPGQTVYFKGIMLRAGGDKSEVAAGVKTLVRFMGANGEEISRLDLTSSPFGSIHGSFTAPVGSLTGQMHIMDEYGSAWFPVEDYKRPKFEVVIDSVKGTPRLGEIVRIRGKAMAYAGSRVDRAQVKYRVVRTARYPDWWWWTWRNTRPRSPLMEITSGTAMTDDTGGFALEFTAIPDPAVPRSDQPVFVYEVTVDVTDINGETRSKESRISVGYAALAVSVSIPSRMRRDSVLTFPIVTENLNGVFTSASGKITVHRLRTPARVLRERTGDAPDTAALSKSAHDSIFPGDQYRNELTITTWPRESRIIEQSFSTEKKRVVDLSALKGAQPGAYVLEAGTRDSYGQEVKDIRYFTLYEVRDRRIPYPMADWFVPVRTTCEPGDTAVFLVGSGYRKVRALYEIEHKEKIVRSAWIDIDSGQTMISLPVEEKHRGGVAVHVTFVRENRCYRHSETIRVPWSNKELRISFETFRDRLAPGAKEEWRLKVAGPGKDRVAAEMVATLYDASLDAFVRHAWQGIDIYPRRSGIMGLNSRSAFDRSAAEVWAQTWNPPPEEVEPRVYPDVNWFETAIVGGFRQVSFLTGGLMGEEKSAELGSRHSEVAAKGVRVAGGAPTSKALYIASADASRLEKSMLGLGGGFGGGSGGPEEDETPPPDLSTVSARTNLNETAFFFPALRTNDSGDVIVSFQVPEALTRWRMLGFAHTRDLRFGLVENSLVTQKDLMVTPNPPRFFRENDRMTFTAKVTNLSDKDLKGTAQLFITDAATGRSVDSAFANTRTQVSFSVPRGRSAPLAWDISIPEGVGAVSSKVVARAGDFSDGEEQAIPVLTNRMLVTESLPLPIRRKETKKFTFDKLIARNNGSTTLRNHRLTLEFTSNPAWYAVQALPYLMEYPYECAEQTFARFYANTIAASIANSSPRIKAVFDAWRTQQPEALLSNLQKNQELKSLVLEETPWLLDGRNESERKKRVALLFDLNKMADERGRALGKLREMQTPAGGWPWFEGMPEDRYITQYIVTGLGRLAHLGMVDLRKDAGLREMTMRSLAFLDGRMREDHAALLKHSASTLDSNHLSETQIQYLYARSFLPDVPVPDECRKAVNYFTAQAKRYWLRNSRYLQGMVALALSRSGDRATPPAIMRSLRENALVTEEMGMYWKEMYEQSCCFWWWYHAPIESQALMVEAFDEVAHDTAAVEGLRTWLLKSKQTQDWRTTRATAEACYALLLRGAAWLERPSTVRITLGGTVIDAARPGDAKAEAGTGYFKTSWSGPEITPAMGNITVTKGESGVAWGAVYWQYFENLDKITPHATPLKVTRKLFRKENSGAGPVLVPVNDATGLRPGDKVTVRIELRVDRDMEYVHMKDLRASGLEPVNVLSGCRWQDGLGYYESTRDAATNFFFSFLRKGTYVFEYPLVVSHAGDFSTGVTSIQCMYAPEFTSHSEGGRIRVGRE